MQTGSYLTTDEQPRQRRSTNRIRGVLLRKLWLPRVVYELLPYMYMLLGVGALISAVLTPDWTWVIPYIALVGLICLHAGLGIVALRYRFRRRRPLHDGDT